MITLEFKDIWFSRGDLITAGEDNPLFVVEKTSYNEVQIDSFNKDIPPPLEMFKEGVIWYKVGSLILDDPPVEDNKRIKLVRVL